MAHLYQMRLAGLLGAVRWDTQVLAAVRLPTRLRLEYCNPPIYPIVGDSPAANKIIMPNYNNMTL